MSAGERPSALRIRRAQKHDWPAARLLLAELDDLHAQIAPDYFRSAPRTEGEWHRLVDEPTGVVLVAEPEPSDRVVGIVAVRIYDTPENPAMVPRRRGHVETLVVATDQRKRGIGRRLMAESVAWARAQGAVEIVLTTWAGNAEADAFYERLGYRILSRVLHAKIV